MFFSLSVSFCTLECMILLTSSTGNECSDATFYWALPCHVLSFFPSKRHLIHTEKTQRICETPNTILCLCKMHSLGGFIQEFKYCLSQNKTNFCMSEYNPMDFPLSVHVKLFSSPFILPIPRASDLLSYFVHQVSPYAGFMSWFSLAGYQVPIKAALSLPLLKWTGEKKYNKRLVGWKKNRERSLPNYHDR